MRIAVVLFNLGGPTSLEAVKPFLLNLFNDRAILRIPQPFRWLLAHLIASRRAPLARHIYARMGGSSPILGQTYNQASALTQALSGGEERHFEVFVAMRYSAPRAADVAEQVRRYRPHRIVLLPLYPQYSTATTRSSVEEWNWEAEETRLVAQTSVICCYPDEPGFIAAQTELIAQTLEKLPPNVRFRLLLSAHGLPQRVVSSGDPYTAHVERTAHALVTALGRPGLDWRICYQSRVGPMKWTKPATADEIRRAGEEGLSAVIVPVSFVSEHAETLVELDMDYASLAADAGVPHYLRVPAVGTHPLYIQGLASLVRNAISRSGIHSGAGEKLCPRSCRQCPVEEGPA